MQVLLYINKQKKKSIQCSIAEIFDLQFLKEDHTEAKEALILKD